MRRHVIVLFSMCVSHPHPLPVCPRTVFSHPSIHRHRHHHLLSVIAIPLCAYHPSSFECFCLLGRHGYLVGSLTYHVSLMVGRFSLAPPPTSTPAALPPSLCVTLRHDWPLSVHPPAIIVHLSSHITYAHACMHGLCLPLVAFIIINSSFVFFSSLLLLLLLPSTFDPLSSFARLQSHIIHSHSIRCIMLLVALLFILYPCFGYIKTNHINPFLHQCELRSLKENPNNNVEYRSNQ